MKRTSAFLAVFVMAALLFAACSRTNEPADVAKVFLQAVEKQDLKKMQQHIGTRQEKHAHIIQDENFVKMMCGSIGRELGEKGKMTNEIMTVINDDNTATVIVRLEKGTMNLGMFKGNDGKWKIDVAFE